MMLRSPPTPVNSPSELPIGGIKPAGNGLSRVVRGTSVVSADWFRLVVRVKPIWPCSVAEYLPRRGEEPVAAADDGVVVERPRDADSR